MDFLNEVVRQIWRKRGVMVDEIFVETPCSLKINVVACQVRHVAAMLPMKAHGYPSSPRGSLRLKGGQISAVNNGGVQLPEQFEKFGVEPNTVPWGFVERIQGHIRAANAMTKICNVSQGQHSMPIAVRRHVVNQIDQTIFNAPSGKTIQHMEHKWGLIRGEMHGPRRSQTPQFIAC
jgi:hypothetical protein